jgi:hypothetical protein
MCVTAGKDGREAAVELRSGKKKGAGSGRRGRCIFIRQEAFLTMEHLLSTMVSLPGSPLSVGQAMVIFLYRLLTLTRGPDTIIFELKLASLKYYTP